MMKNILLAICILMISTHIFAVNFPTRESGKYSEICKERWTKRGELDKNMFDYCVDGENKGYEDAKNLVNKYAKQPWIQEFVDLAVKKRTQSGRREDSLLAAEIKMKLDAWEDMAYEAKQPKFNKAKYEACAKQWGIEFGVLAACYKKQ